MSSQPKKSSKTALVAILSTVIIGGAAIGGTLTWASQNSYAVKVNSESISLEKYNVALERAKKQYEGQIGMDFNSEAGKKALTNIRENIVKTLVELSILKQEAEKMNLTVKPEELETKIKDFIKTNYKGNKEAFAEDLKKHRYTEADFKDQMKERLLMGQLYQKIIKDVKVTDADVKSFYESNQDKFKVADQIEAQHILIKTEETEAMKKEKDEKKKALLKTAEEAKALKKALGLMSQLKTGAKFEDLVVAHSADPGSKNTGGKYTFPKGQMVPEFEKAAWGLKPGELVPEPVKTQFGYHIIKRGKDVPGHLKPLDEVKAQVEAQLKREKPNKTFEAWLKDKKEKATIDVNKSLKTDAAAIKKDAPPASNKPGDDGHGHGH